MVMYLISYCGAAGLLGAVFWDVFGPLGNYRVFTISYGAFHGVFAGTIFFLFLQSRELKRFYQTLDATKKEQQLAHVLDSQSDAVVVVQTEPE